MPNPEDGNAPNGLSRRELIKRAAIYGGAAVWAVPVITMAASRGDSGPDTHNLDGAQLVFEGACASTPLDGIPTARTVCATTLSKAKTAFTSQVTTECTTKCGLLGPCTSPAKCQTAKRGGVTVGTVTCTGPGANCPVPPYATNTKLFVCSATVTCNCVCR